MATDDGGWSSWSSGPYTYVSLTIAHALRRMYTSSATSLGDALASLGDALARDGDAPVHTAAVAGLVIAIASGGGGGARVRTRRRSWPP